MIRLHIKTGLLGEHGTEKFHIEWRRGLTPRSLAEEFRAHLPQSVELGMGVDGVEVAGEAWDQELRDGQDVILLPQTTAPVLLVVLQYVIIPLVVGIAVNYVMNLLSPRPKPPGLGLERGDDASATYAWNGVQTQYGQGFPVGWAYGRHVLGGQVIYTDVQSSNGDDLLRLVLALCEGPIYRVGDVLADEIDGLGGTSGSGSGGLLPNHIRINNTLLENSATTVPLLNVITGVWSGSQPLQVGEVLTVYSGGTKVGSIQVVELRNTQATNIDALILSDICQAGHQLVTVGGGVATVQTAATVFRTNATPGAKVWIRPGTLDQRPLPANPFRGASTAFSPGEQLDEANQEAIFSYNGTEELTTVGFVFAAPGGIYAQDAQGNLAAFPVRIDLSWRPVGTTSWRSFHVIGGTGQSVPSTIIGDTARLGPALHSFGVNLADQFGPAARGPIEVRVIRRSPNGGIGSVSQVVWRNVFFNQAHEFAYPRVAHIGLELLAGARFNGSLPNILVRIDAALVRVWDAVNGFSPRCWDRPAAPFDFMPSNSQPGRNPAWVLADFLTAKWGLGNYLKDADLDWPSFRRWAAFCDQDPSPLDPWGEPQFQVNIVGDQPRPAWEWVLAICAAGRATPIYLNGKIGVVYQYAAAHGDLGITVPAKEPTQLLTSGNCEDVQVTWLPQARRATVFLFQFLNEDNLFVQDVLPVHDPEGTFDLATSQRKESYRPETIQAYGVTNIRQIFREGIFRHRAQRRIRREVQLTTGRWALAAGVGELVMVEHVLMRPFGTDVPMNMAVRTGGAAVTSIVVDHAAPGAQQIAVRDPDGKPQVRTVTAAVVSGKTTTLTLAAAVTCTNGAPCVVGLTDKLVQKYEIVSINLQEELKRRVRAVQWVESIHDPITPDMYETGSTGTDFLGQPEQEVPTNVSDVRVVAMRDGTHIIVWSRSPNRAGDRARVYVRNVTADVWILAGSTETDEMPFRDFVAWQSYEVSVCMPTSKGQPQLPDAGTRISFIAEEFPPFSPPSITNARVQVLDEFLLLQWDDLDVRDLTYYEVRLGSEWSSGQVVYRERAPRALLGNPPGGGTAMVAARSTSGLYGNPVPIVLPAWSPRNQVLVAGDDDLAGTPAGSHSDTQWNVDGYIELAAGEYSGQYTSAEQDVGYQAPVYWQVQVDRAELEDIPLGECHFKVGSGESRWRTIAGRAASPSKSAPDWQTKLGDLTMTLEDLGRHPEILVQGHAGEVGSHTRVFVESRFEISGVWSAWKEHHDRTVVARKMQVRVTIDRESIRYQARVTALVYAAFL